MFLSLTVTSVSWSKCMTPLSSTRVAVHQLRGSEGSKNLKSPVRAYPQSRADSYGLDMGVSAQLAFPTRTVQNPVPRKWCHPQGSSFFNPITRIRMISPAQKMLQRHATKSGQHLIETLPRWLPVFILNEENNRTNTQDLRDLKVWSCIFLYPQKTIVWFH